MVRETPRALFFFAWALAAALLVGFWAGCQSPTLPLPPPSTPVVTPGAEWAEVHADNGSAVAGALVMVYNVDTGEGAITTATSKGGYHTRVRVDFVRAPGGNTLEIWQREGNNHSPSISKFVHPPP